MTPKNKQTTRQMIKYQKLRLSLVMFLKYSHERKINMTIQMTEEYFTMTAIIKATAISMANPKNAPDPKSNSKNNSVISDMVF